jgi:hypothetical protein
VPFANGKQRKEVKPDLVLADELSRTYCESVGRIDDGWRGIKSLTKSAQAISSHHQYVVF